ncbi:MAG: NUDIX hydrolase [Sphingomonas sp.]|nr:NUDIX hydrolase [Sphingomonas sp.]
MADPVYADPIPAATLVLFRARAGGPPELLIVERAAAMAFAGGALVFPGGRVDAGDRALALRDLGGDSHGAARIAAIREMIEEAGLAIGLTPLPDATQLAAIRSALHHGAAFADLLDGHGLSLDPTALVPFARWCPRHANMRIFDTMFFLAALPDGAPEPVVDATENSRVFWATAQAVLDDADAGRVTIIFPTRRNLERLACFPDFDAAVADAIRFGTPMITPWTEQRDGAEHLCIPDDAGYPVTAERLSDAKRA